MSCEKMSPMPVALPGPWGQGLDSEVVKTPDFKLGLTCRA